MINLSYEQIKEIKVGEVYFESGQHGNIKFTVKEEPTEFECECGAGVQIRWVGSVEGHNDIDYLLTKGAEHYGPSIYTSPAYVGVREIGY